MANVPRFIIAPVKWRQITVFKIFHKQHLKAFTAYQFRFKHEICGNTSHVWCNFSLHTCAGPIYAFALGGGGRGAFKKKKEFIIYFIYIFLHSFSFNFIACTMGEQAPCHWFGQWPLLLMGRQVSFRTLMSPLAFKVSDQTQVVFDQMLPCLTRQRNDGTETWSDKILIAFRLNLSQRGSGNKCSSIFSAGSQSTTYGFWYMVLAHILNKDWSLF